MVTTRWRRGARRLTSPTVLLAFGAALLPGRAALAQPADAEAVLRRARTEFATVRTARAEFTQEIRNPLTARTLTSRGTLLQRKPGKLAVTFADPAGDRIVSDGTHVWVYLPSSAPGQVLRMPAGDGGTGGVDLAATVLDASREGYTVTLQGARAVGGQPATGVTLVGKPGADVPFPRATLWIDDATSVVREVAITDAQGIARTIRITSWQKNVPVDDAAFRFAVPKGTKVIDAP
jgi:outer membrane lipoprotein carrier protein